MPPLEPETNLPRFYRHHQPKGSPPELNLTFEGLAPTGPLPASVDFALRRQDEPKAFDVVMVTDPQPETGAEVDFVREDLIQALAGVDARFGLTAGDIMFDDLSLYPRSNAIIRHDRTAVVEHRRQSRSQSRSARPPVQPRDFQARLRPQLLRVLLRPDPLPDARRRRTISASIRTSPGEGASTRAGSTRGNSSSCATCSPTRRKTRWSSS